MEVNIYDLSGIYGQQSFYNNIKHNYYDLRGLKGSYCYCDEPAAQRFEAIPRSGRRSLNYLDSGSYHYISYFHLKTICEDFHLVLLDNHPDANLPTFLRLSCGSWVYNSMSELHSLKAVSLIGVEPELMKEVRDNILSTGFEEICFDEAARRYIYARRGVDIDLLPVYISIDKDVMSETFAHTSWSQGIMSDDLLFDTIKPYFEYKILGIDVCGEAEMNDDPQAAYNDLNEIFNVKLLKFIESYIF